MNKVININLGGLPFVIDDDAYSYLASYLQSIKKHFSFSESREEIMYDIEVRIAELFQEKLKYKQIISMSELDSIIKIMGKPEDFGGEPIDENFSFNNESKSYDYKYVKTGKKLFRDPDNKIISGVCSGISTYLGIEDPVWVRAFFGLLLFAGGSGVLIYLFLTIAVPKARSSSDKLAMKGEPINIDNIAKKVQEEIDNLTQSINDFGEDISHRSKTGNWDFTKKAKP
jgi:phage shock protein PspC (stress-responsive transcriptional regulator)